MSRPWRIQFPGAVYHIISRGNNRQEIFLDTEDRYDFLDLTGHASYRFRLQILAFCLMSNHFHLFLRTKDANLSKAMQWLSATYASHFHRRHKSSGHIFQGRYKSVLVTDEAHYLNLGMYIHLNPVRAGICKDPADYEWSSFRDYTRTKSRFSWLHPEEILKHYGPEGAGSRREYRKNCIALAGKPPSFWQEIRAAVFLGSMESLEKLKKKHKPEGDICNVTGYLKAGKKHVDFDAEIKKISRAFQVPAEEILKRRRNFTPRQAAYYHLVCNCRMSPTEVGKLMGVRQTSVSTGTTKFKEMKLKKDKKIKRIMETLIVN
jgi:REP element-mobilizing transposase RayT